MALGWQTIAWRVRRGAPAEPLRHGPLAPSHPAPRAAPQLHLTSVTHIHVQLCWCNYTRTHTEQPDGRFWVWGAILHYK